MNKPMKKLRCDSDGWCTELDRVVQTGINQKGIVQHTYFCEKRRIVTRKVVIYRTACGGRTGLPLRFCPWCGEYLFPLMAINDDGTWRDV